MQTRRSSRKRKRKKEPAATSAAEPSYATMLDVEAFVSHFGDAKPKKGTLDVWKTHVETKEKLIGDLRTLTMPDPGFNLDKAVEESTRLLDPKQRAGLFQNLDMDIDWSSVDTTLNEGKKIGGRDKSSTLVRFWAKSLILDVMECLQAISVVHQKLNETKLTLRSLCLFSNKTEVSTFATQTQEDELLDKDECKRLTRGVVMPSPTKPEHLIQHGEVEDEVWASPWSDPTIDDNIENELTKFAALWSTMISKAEITEPLMRNSTTNKEKADYKAKMLKTANHLQEWAKVVDPEAENLTFAFPNEFAGEKDAVQPILYSLLRVLSQIGTENHGRDDIRRERHHESTGRRFMDYEPLFLDSFVPILLSHHITMAVEAKNIARKNKSAEAMHGEVVNQLTGYMAKRLRVAFDVGNVGVDANATGVLMTPTYVQVVRLELVNMGTKDVQLKHRKTAMFPLVSLEGFNKIVEKEANKDYLRPLLFPADTTEPRVPKGLQVLWALMHASDEEIGASFFDAMATARFHSLKDPETATDFEEDGPPHEATHLCGTGAHGTVYRSSTNDNTCIKASRVGETIYIERELEALKLLNAGVCRHIPKLACVGKLEYKIRCVTAAVPAILISPLGIPVRVHLGREIQHVGAANDKEIRKTLAMMIKKDTEAALKFAHKRKVYHLDVRLDNIVYDESSRAFVLIDWANAARDGEKVTGFRGSLAFAHAEIHTKNNTDKWSPKVGYDFASLGFTFAAFMDGHEVPWHGFSSRLKKKDHPCIIERRENTIDIFEKLKIPAVDIMRKAVNDG